MRELAVQRVLNDSTRKQAIWTKSGKVYSLHIKNSEAIVTDNSDYTKIYAIYSLDYFNENS